VPVTYRPRSAYRQPVLLGYDNLARAGPATLWGSAWQTGPIRDTVRCRWKVAAAADDDGGGGDCDECGSAAPPRRPSS